MPSPWSPDACRRALLFAERAHRGQTMKGSDHPYILHPVLVAAEIAAALADEPGRDGDLAVACALLHDVVEDCGVTAARLRAEFGRAVAAGVAALSKDPAVEKEARLRDSLQRIRRQPREVWMVKMADRIVNLAPPPPDWTRAKVARYRRDARLILDALKAASPRLAKRLRDKIRTYGPRPRGKRHGTP